MVSIENVSIQMTCCLENSQVSLAWNYAENINDGRGITFGCIGFCTGTYDGNVLIKYYTTLNPSNVLAKYIPALNVIDAGPHTKAGGDGNDSVVGLTNFITDVTNCADPLFKQAQVYEMEQLYWNPAVALFIQIGAKYPLTQAFLYDCCVRHGEDGAAGFITTATSKSGGTPKTGVNETTFLTNLMVARDAALKSENLGDTDRDVGWKTVLTSGNTNLNVPFSFSAYGDSFTIDGNIGIDTGGDTPPSPAIPVASYTVAPQTGNIPLTVQFTDTSTNTPTSWLWSFGDGTTSTTKNPSHTYTVAGVYTVTLTATNASGSGSITGTLTVTSSTQPKPIANFTYSPASGNAPLTVQFNDASTNAPTSWNWNFGDNSALVTTQNPSHIFPNVGTFTITLTVTNSYGTSSLSNTVIVNSSSPSPLAPVAGFTFTPTTGNVPLAVAFTNTSTNIGSGATGDPTPAQIYSVVAPRMVAANRVTGNMGTSQDGTLGIYVYDLDYTGVNKGKYYAVITAMAIDTDGSDPNSDPDHQSETTFQDAAGQQLSSLRVPWWVIDDVVTTLPNFPWGSKFNIDGMQLGAVVYPSSKASSGGAKLCYAVFGDSQGSEDDIADLNHIGEGSIALANFFGINPSGTVGGVNADVMYIFSTGAANRITLANGYTGTNATLAADATKAGPSWINQMLTDLGGSSNPTTSSFIWNFGDGSPTVTTLNATHTYTQAGTFLITLTVTNPNGSNSTSKNIPVNATTPTPPKPVANFTYTPTSGNNPLTVTFTDTSSNTPTSWSWNFGDGSAVVTTKSPSHVFSTVGTFNVTLTVTNSNGSSSISNTVTVTSSTPTPTPVASFTATPSSGNAPLGVTFTDNSTNTPIAWSWNFGDNSALITTKTTNHTYTKTGTFIVTLTVTNAGGSASVSKNISVTSSTPVPNAPVASFTASPISGAAPLTVTFTDTSTKTPTSWSWNFGDGSAAATTKTATHIYATAGTYSVMLTATNGSGSGTASLSITVTGSSTPATTYTLNLQGSQFDATSSTVLITLDGLAIANTVVQRSTTLIVITIQFSKGGTYLISVKNGNGEVSNSISFVVGQAISYPCRFAYYIVNGVIVNSY